MLLAAIETVSSWPGEIATVPNSITARNEVIAIPHRRGQTGLEWQSNGDKNALERERKYVPRSPIQEEK